MGEGGEDANQGRERERDRQKWRRGEFLKSLFVSRDEVKEGASWLVGQRLSPDERKRVKRRGVLSQKV